MNSTEDKGKLSRKSVDNKKIKIKTLNLLKKNIKLKC